MTREILVKRNEEEAKLEDDKSATFWFWIFFLNLKGAWSAIWNRPRSTNSRNRKKKNKITNKNRQKNKQQTRDDVYVVVNVAQPSLAIVS